MDAAGLPGSAQAQCLRELARPESAQTAAHARVLSAFNAGSAYEVQQDHCGWRAVLTPGGPPAVMWIVNVVIR